MNLLLNKKLALQKDARDSKHKFPWSSCLPFFDNKLAKLIHRPRKVSTYTQYKYPYEAIHAWCGNTFVGENKFTFLSDLPDGSKLLCQRCEMLAVENGLPSAEELTGRHVHIGKLKAIRTCCIEVTK